MFLINKHLLYIQLLLKSAYFSRMAFLSTIVINAICAKIVQPFPGYSRANFINRPNVDLEMFVGNFTTTIFFDVAWNQQWLAFSALKNPYAWLSVQYLSGYKTCLSNAKKNHKSIWLSYFIKLCPRTLSTSLLVDSSSLFLCFLVMNDVHRGVWLLSSWSLSSFFIAVTDTFVPTIVSHGHPASLFWWHCYSLCVNIDYFLLVDCLGKNLLSIVFNLQIVSRLCLYNKPQLKLVIGVCQLPNGLIMLWFKVRSYWLAIGFIIVYNFR